MVQSQSGSLRGLKALVAVLGILVVLGTAVVAGAIIKRLLAPAAPPPGISALPPAAAASTLPPGSRILGLAGAGNAFAIWTTAPSGAQIYLLDPATGALRLAIQAPPPAAQN